MRLILQLINDISRVLQKKLKYFNRTAILTFFHYHYQKFFVIFSLNLNDSDFAIL